MSIFFNIPTTRRRLPKGSIVHYREAEKLRQEIEDLAQKAGLMSVFVSGKGVIRLPAETKHLRIVK